MLLSKPVVATGWSGNMEFMDPQSSALVGYRLIPARDPRGTYDVPHAVWADPDLTDAVGHLQRLADDQMERKALGARARETAQSRLGLGPFRTALAALLGLEDHFDDTGVPAKGWTAFSLTFQLRWLQFDADTGIAGKLRQEMTRLYGPNVCPVNSQRDRACQPA